VLPGGVAGGGNVSGAGRPTPDRLLDALERAELLERALAELPEAERETLLLRDVEQLAGEDAARIMGISLAAMKSRLHRGRLHLARSLEQLADA